MVDDPDDLPEEEPRSTNEKNYITPAGYRKLVDELEFLHTSKRAEGDRSENAEYIYRKRQLRQIDARMRFLSKRLDHVAIVDPKEQRRRDRVFFGATVTVEDEDEVTLVYRIVGQDEIEGAEGVISWKSPVGKALLGKAVGDTVVVRWHAGVRELTVTAITYL
jgi:transcription elongation factor GreB